MAQWRTVLARERRSPPGFILPCQPVLAKEVPTGSEWIHELKWDGYRIIARRERGYTRLWSRNARNWAEAFPRIVEAVERLPVESIVLDGEAVCLTDDGRSDFHALQSEACRDARLVCFDLLAINGRDLRQLPLWARRKQLAALLEDYPEDPLLFSSHVEGAEGEALFRHACEMNLEGIVSKRVASPYKSGRFEGWRKIKCRSYQRT
jgi:bifunctional non-homologous end joining protein LigD